jgi:hypothetical protein
MNPKPNTNPGADVRAQAAEMLGIKLNEVDAFELEVINELIDTARMVLQVHRGEMQAHMAAIKSGEPIETRWQVSPGVAERIARLMLKLLNARRERLHSPEYRAAA